MHAAAVRMPGRCLQSLHSTGGQSLRCCRSCIAHKKHVSPWMWLVQAFPTQHALADALRKQRPLMANKKRLSRLKRIILKERGEKALGDATDALAKASQRREAAHAQRISIQAQLKVCPPRDPVRPWTFPTVPMCL